MRHIVLVIYERFDEAVIFQNHLEVALQESSKTPSSHDQRDSQPSSHDSTPRQIMSSGTQMSRVILMKYNPRHFIRKLLRYIREYKITAIYSFVLPIQPMWPRLRKNAHLHSHLPIIFHQRDDLITQSSGDRLDGLDHMFVTPFQETTMLTVPFEIAPDLLFENRFDENTSPVLDVVILYETAMLQFYENINQLIDSISAICHEGHWTLTIFGDLAVETYFPDLYEGPIANDSMTLGRIVIDLTKTNTVRHIKVMVNKRLLVTFSQKWANVLLIDDNLAINVSHYLRDPDEYQRITDQGHSEVTEYIRKNSIPTWCQQIKKMLLDRPISI